MQKKNRLQAPSQPKAVLSSLKTTVPRRQCQDNSAKTTVRFLEKEVERLKKQKRLKEQIRQHFKDHDGLQHDAQLLQSIPGAELPDVGQFDSAQAVAAYAGLAPP